MLRSVQQSWPIPAKKRTRIHTERERNAHTRRSPIFCPHHPTYFHRSPRSVRRCQPRQNTQTTSYLGCPGPEQDALGREALHVGTRDSQPPLARAVQEAEVDLNASQQRDPRRLEEKNESNKFIGGSTDKNRSSKSTSWQQVTTATGDDRGKHISGVHTQHPASARRFSYTGESSAGEPKFSYDVQSQHIFETNGTHG